MEVYIDYLQVFILVLLSIIVFSIFVLVVYNAFLKIAVDRFEYNRYFSTDGIFEGEEMFLIEEFLNRSFIPMFNITVESYVPKAIKLLNYKEETESNQHFISRFFVMPYTKVKRKHKVLADKRGYYKLETAQISFKNNDLYLESFASLHIYPREIAVNNENDKNLFAQYTNVSKRPLIRDVFSFSGIKEYTYGDSLNLMNYKASSKMGKLMVNQSDYLYGKRVMIMINMQLENVYNEGKLVEKAQEKALSFASFLVADATKRGYQVGFSCNSRMINGDYYVRVMMESGEAHYKEILECLANVNLNYGNSFVSLLDKEIDCSTNNTEIYLISAYTDEEIDKRIGILERNNNNITILDFKLFDSEHES